MMTLLDQYNALNVKSDVLGDKLKVQFIIDDQETALKCFTDFNKMPFLNDGKDRAKIFYLKPGNKQYH